MNYNLIFEIILILFAILASNGIIYGLTIFNLNNPNSSENISVITNSSERDILPIPLLIASNPITITSSESSTSQTLDMTSSETNVSQTLSVTSSETNVSQTLSVTSSETSVSTETFDSTNLIDSGINEGIVVQIPNFILVDTDEGIIPSNLDASDHIITYGSQTILDSQTVEQWRELVGDLHDLPINTPANIIQQVKFEELNVLYRQDIIEFGITQSELRHIIELFPAWELFNPDINYIILTIMSYFHL
jgi:hypothetical protein